MTNPFTELSEKLEEIRREVRQKAPDPDWMNLDEACTYLNLGKSAIYKRTMNGQIPFYKFGKKLAFRRHELNEFITSHRGTGGPARGVKIEK